MPFDFDFGQSDDNSSSSSKGSSKRGTRKRRSTVIVTGAMYASHTFPPDTECENCSRKAEGVIVIERKVGDKKTLVPIPLCKNHRRGYEAKYPKLMKASDYKTFAGD